MTTLVEAITTLNFKNSLIAKLTAWNINEMQRFCVMETAILSLENTCCINNQVMAIHNYTTDLKGDSCGSHLKI